MQRTLTAGALLPHHGRLIDKVLSKGDRAARRGAGRQAARPAGGQNVGESDSGGRRSVRLCTCCHSQQALLCRPHVAAQPGRAGQGECRGQVCSCQLNVVACKVRQAGEGMWRRAKQACLRPAALLDMSTCWRQQGTQRVCWQRDPHWTTARNRTRRLLELVSLGSSNTWVAACAR